MIEYLEIQSFGRVELRWRESRRRIDIAPREEALLIYLAYQGIPISRSELSDFFWPDEPANRARGNLRKLLADVRKSSFKFIKSDREQIWLEDHPYWFDVHEFQRLTQSVVHLYSVLNENRSITDRNTQITETEITRLTEGIRLYHGDFLANFKTPQSHRFTAWLEEEQRHWQEHAITVCMVLMEHAISSNQHPKATAYARRLLGIDPYHEEAHGQLMRLLVNQQQTNSAIAHYEQYIERLQVEPDTEIESELTELYRQIRMGIVPPLTPNSTQVMSFEPSVATSKFEPIPTPVTPIIGRRELLNQLHTYLQKPALRLITLVGLGGVGKSRVALALSEFTKSEFHENICFVALERWLAGFKTQPLSAEQSLSLLTKATAEAIGVTTEATDLQLEQQIVQRLEQGRTLFIFDGFENVVEGAPFLCKLLQAVPTIKIVVTSREVLQIPGEVVVKVEGLTWAAHPSGLMIQSTLESREALTVEPFLPPAIELFTTTAQRQLPELTFTAINLTQIGEICALVDGNPLAIELAAGLVAHYSYAELIILLSENLQPLQAVGRRWVRRHYSIQEVLEESWRLLSKTEQNALTQLSLLPRHFHRAKAVQLEGISPNVLIGLTAKSMLQPMGQGSYQLPNLVQLFATEKRQQIV